MPLSEETVGGTSLPPTVTLTVKEATLEKVKLNLVITKDLSRLGRDYIQTGYYTDVYFSWKRVRYIAVNDGIDTNRDDNGITPF